MIRIERPKAPDIYASKAYQQAQLEFDAHYRDTDLKVRQQKSFRAPSSSGSVERFLDRTRTRLEAAQLGKCAYCETSLDLTLRAAEHDHYRPARGARGHDAFHDEHYWWLVLEWDNLMLLCPRCSMAKGSWFPLADESTRAAVGARGQDLAGEEPLLLDPFVDEPSEHLRFLDDGSVSGRTVRGRTTVEILNLNRPDLRQQRASRIDALYRTLDLGQDVATLLAPASPYVGAARAAMARRNLTVDGPPVEPPDTGTGGQAPWLLLLGENAVGKSSVLQALALTPMGREALEAQAHVSPMDVLRYVREGD